MLRETKFSKNGVEHTFRSKMDCARFLSVELWLLELWLKNGITSYEDAQQFMMERRMSILEKRTRKYIYMGEEVTIPDMAEKWGVGIDTARKFVRNNMPFVQFPRVYEWKCEDGVVRNLTAKEIAELEGYNSTYIHQLIREGIKSHQDIVNKRGW